MERSRGWEGKEVEGREGGGLGLIWMFCNQMVFYGWRNFDVSLCRGYEWMWDKIGIFI